MAGYDHYSNRGYTSYNPPCSDDYESRTGYVPDHVCRPVIIGADGRKRPLISYGRDQNADHYVTNTERHAEQHVHSYMEPNTGGGHARPSQSSVAAPPNASLSSPTNDIQAVVGLLREVAKPRVSTSPRTRYTEPTYTNTIDSKEASRRYGNFNFASRPNARDDGYTSTIDSREALRKYSGSAV